MAELATDFDIAPQELNNLADVLVVQLEVALTEIRRNPQDIDLNSFGRGYLGVIVVIRELAKMRANGSAELDLTEDGAEQAISEFTQRYGKKR